MKKILCPTDFSDAAQNGIAYAAKLAKVINGELTLLNVHSSIEFVPPDSGKDLASITKQLQLESDEINRTFHVPCNAVVETTLRTLTSVIEDLSDQYDLIVMGSNGPDNIYQFFRGTNAYNAAVNAKVPVLIVPEKYVYSEIRNIVYAFDYLKERKLPLEKLTKFASVLKAQVTVLQIMEEAESKGAAEDLHELQLIIKNLYSGDVPLKYETLRSSDIALSVNRYVSNVEADMLSVCSVHMNVVERLFHKSVIKNIAATSDFPVFVFHP
ncbi:MAG TPA: universal stress protein [Chryseolinea sp.]|nr:universal stress protein [Chryseolinea sp.]